MQALQHGRRSWHALALTPPSTPIGADTQTAIRGPALRLLHPCGHHRVHLHIRAEPVAPNHTRKPTTGRALAHRHSAANVRTLPASPLHSVARNCVDALGRTRAHRRDGSFHRTTCAPRGPSGPRTLATSDTPPSPATCPRPTRSADTPTPNRQAVDQRVRPALHRTSLSDTRQLNPSPSPTGWRCLVRPDHRSPTHPPAQREPYTHRRGARLAHTLHLKYSPTGTTPHETNTAWAPRCRPIRV